MIRRLVLTWLTKHALKVVQKRLAEIEAKKAEVESRLATMPEPKRDRNAPEHVHECEYERHRGKEDFGCTCACGAVHHLDNWQTPKVLDQ